MLLGISAPASPDFGGVVVHVIVQFGGIVMAAGAIFAAGKWVFLPHFREWLHREILTPVQETHKSVTVNSGVSNPPTMLDEIHDMRDEVADVRQQLGQVEFVVGATAARTSDLGDRLDDMRGVAEDARDLSKQTRDELREHERKGQEYLGQVRVVMETKGIELPGPDD